MRRILALAGVVAAAVWAGQGAPLRAAAERPLQIYWVDVEGGAATLLVTPERESVLVDTGWPGFEGRDPERIRRAAQAAGVERIDHLVTTHWHVDHYGGIERLSELVPVGRYYDKGIPESLAEDRDRFPTLIAAYRKASEGKRTTLRPGDRIPLRQPAGGPPLELRCLAADGEVTAVRPARSNPECAGHVPKPADTSDNAKSIVLRLAFGPFRFLDGGDLTWNEEQELVCPTDAVGKIDLYQANHHGLDQSNNPVLIRTIQPRVAVINNGPRKGGSAPTFATLKATPGVQAIFQVHRNVATGPEDNAPPAFIANMAERCDGHYVKAEVSPDGRRYTISMSGNPGSHTYETR